MRPSKDPGRPVIATAAFTLVELLVVIAIIGVLIALLLPAVQAARETARRSSCVNKLRQQATALQNYHASEDRFPPGGRVHDGDNQTGVSWRVLILPFVEEGVLHDRISPTANGGARDWSPQTEMPGLFSCPSSEPATLGPAALQIAHYWGVGGAARAGEGLDLLDLECGGIDANGVLFPGSDTRFATITDGSSHTLAIGERTYFFRAWMTGATADRNSAGDILSICAESTKQLRYPLNADNLRFGYFVADYSLPAGGTQSMLLNDLPFGSDHPGGANFAMADGSVHFLPDDIDFTVLEDLATINGGEVNRWPE